jgi:hypothetical protein
LRERRTTRSRGAGDVTWKISGRGDAALPAAPARAPTVRAAAAIVTVDRAIVAAFQAAISTRSVPPQNLAGAVPLTHGHIRGKIVQ